MAGGHGSRQAWWEEQKAERNRAREREVVQSYIPSKPDRSDVFPSARPHPLNPRQVAPPNRDQVFKYLSLWGAFLKETSTGTKKPVGAA